MSTALRLFAAGGVGLSEGYGTPDWRALAGLWLGAGHGKATAPAPVEPPLVEPPVVDTDSDRDGVAIPADACPEDKETRNGVEDDDGCPDVLPDTDGDGQSDPADECPTQAEDADDFQDDDGCPDLDNDADGVVDTSDRCVDEPGVIENGGCPDTDRDGDTVADRLDNCPDEPGTVKRGSGTSRCEWKGLATYYDVVMRGRRLAGVAWSYERPLVDARSITGYLAFYANALTCCVAGERAVPQPGGFYGGWITPELVGPFKGEPGSDGW